MDTLTEFYDRHLGDMDSVPILQRPSRILYHYTRRLAKQARCELDIVYANLARKTGISVTELKGIVGGEHPSPSQLFALHYHLKWTFMFLFGITESAFDQTFMDFCAAGRLEGTASLRRAFMRLYTRCLEQKSREEWRARHE